MKNTAIAAAERILSDFSLKREAQKLIDNYQEPLKDLIVIFVTSDWEVDAFWSELDGAKLRKVIRALEKGTKKID